MLDQNGFDIGSTYDQRQKIAVTDQLLGHPALDIIGEATARLGQQATQCPAPPGAGTTA